ncbi:MAG: 3-dehydroquinate synthase [Desulfobacterales bacterium]|nr:3-dehydroquinate synthase [Desulfobacterales bacterium]
MKTRTISGQTGKSQILAGESLDNLAGYLPAGRTVIITDDNVERLYSAAFPSREVIPVGQGEAVKTLETVSAIYDQLIESQADRSVFLLGIGGGIVCDIAGFVASTYLRGVRFGYVPTTLLAQVDASVGGKTGVNFRGYKNMVGVFNQPGFVLCDPRVLKTLPARDLACGFAEVVKHAAIYDADYFEFLEQEASRARSLDPEVMTRVVYDSIAIKADVVSRDEREKGERRKLNFGHTFGHAVEKTEGLPHGEAVAIGMMMAARLSMSRHMLDQKSVDRLAALLSAFHLPLESQVDQKQIMDALARDKKREGDEIHFVLLERLGRAVVQAIPISELQELIGLSE